MELFLITGYIALCVAVFTVLRIPLNRWTVPTASIGGVALVFALIQLLNFYHPYSDRSQQHLAIAPNTQSVTGEHTLVAWFHQNSLFRLNDGTTAEVTFDSLPGKVFTARLQMVLSPKEGDHARAQDKPFDSSVAERQYRIPVLINITDSRYAGYTSLIADGSQAQTAVYGEQFHQLASVRKTLLRMSAWMNYLTLFS
jgi:hypothetical protein